MRAERRPYHLFPLQLDGDYQLREHSPFPGIAPAIDAVLTSFARRAPADARLLVKEHPLNSGLVDWSGPVAAAAARLGVADRVSFVDGGVLELMLEHAAGVVTINSTVGFLALGCGIPTIAIGEAIYGIPRLTFQGGLDEFWTAGERPDPRVFDAFRRVVARRTQLNGGFFSERGIQLAVAAAVERLEGPVQRPEIQRAPAAAGRPRPAPSGSQTAGFGSA